MFINGVFQSDENDCGPAALATVLSIYRKKIPLYKIKNEVLKNTEGSSIWGLSSAAKTYDLKPNELQGNYNELIEAINTEEVKFPFIAHVIKDEFHYHFIVVVKKKQDKIHIFDPSSGTKKLSGSEFEKIWTGNIITFEKSESFKTEYINIGFLKSLSLLKEYKKYLYLNLFIMVIISFFSIVSAKLYQNIVDVHIMKTNSSTIIGSLFTTENIKYLLLVFIMLTILQNIFNFILEFSLIKINTQMEKQLSYNFYDKIFKLPFEFYENRKAGDFLTRVQDIEITAKYLSNTILSCISSLLMALIGGIILFNINFQLFTIVLIGTSLYVVASVPIIPLFARNSRKVVEKRSYLFSKIKESIDTIETIKIMINENEFTNNIRQTSNQYINLKRSTALLLSVFQFIISNLESIMNGAVLFFGILLVMNGDLTLGSYLAFHSLMLFFISPIKELVDIRTKTQEYLISYDRLQDFLTYESEYYEDEYCKLLKNCDLYLNNISFSYPSKESVVKQMNCIIREGDKVFIEGRNGTGKSTLMRMINKSINPDEGNISLGEKLYKDLPVNFIRSKVMYSSQENYILNGTLEENLFLKDINSQYMKSNFDRLINSNILDSILKDFEQGLQTIIKEKGSNLSEGQKQIIGISRLLIKGAPIMIFDESISKVDIQTKNKIIDFIFENYIENTCIFIDHENTMKEKCDYIINMNDSIPQLI